MEVYEPAALTSPEAIKPCGQFRGARWSCRPPAAPTPRSRPRQAWATRRSTARWCASSGASVPLPA